MEGTQPPLSENEIFVMGGGGVLLHAPTPLPLYSLTRVICLFDVTAIKPVSLSN